MPPRAALDVARGYLHTGAMTRLEHDMDAGHDPDTDQDVDPNGPPPADAGLYGFDVSLEAARVVVQPVPVEATTSYRPGTKHGPEAVRRASHQVDLYDVDVGEAWRCGIRLEAALEGVFERDDEARRAAVRAIDAQAEGRAPDGADLAFVNAFLDDVRAALFTWTGQTLAAGKLPVVLGGDHSAPLGAIEAAADAIGRPLGVLHVDAHADLRVAYEGFEQSHASIMHNVLERVPNASLVQVGLRDISGPELARIRGDDRVTAVFAPELRRARVRGDVESVLSRAVAALPDDVWVSFDIDGLDPLYCPNTGTPVPGGLTFDEAVHLLELLARSDKRVVGLDLCEVAPPPTQDEERPDEWDALVGARLLYKMIGFATGAVADLG